MKIKKNKPVKKIRSAILWQAPSPQALNPKRTVLEEQQLDYKVTEILAASLEANKPDFAIAKKKLSKNKSLVLHFASTLSRLSPVDLSSYLDSQSQAQDEAQVLYQSLIIKTYTLYQDLKIFYKPRLIRQQSLIKKYTQAKTQLIALCGLNGVQEIENLIRSKS